MNVVLRPTCNAYVEIRNVKPDKFLDELENLFSRGWNGRRDRALVECINNDVSRSVRLDGEHCFEAFYHRPIIWLPHSTIMRIIESGEYTTTGIGLSRKLDEE